MKILKIIAATAFATCSLLSADAQTGGKNSKKPEKKSGTITFDSRSTTSPSSRFSKNRKEEWKTNSGTVGVLSALLHGYLPFYYERGLTSKLSVQAGVGVTFRSVSNTLGESISPYADGDLFGTGSPFGTGTGNIADDYTDYTYRNTAPGYMVSLSPRFYPGDDHCMNGFYLSPVFAYKVFRTKAQLADITADPSSGGSEINEVPRSSSKANESLRCTDILFQLGGHHQASSKFVVGWSFAVGARIAKAKRLDIDSRSSSVGSGYVFTNDIREWSSTRPVFELNLLFGRLF